MTKIEDFIEIGKFKQGHCSSMLKEDWCDLNSDCAVLKLHDMCHDRKCKRQKKLHSVHVSFN